MSETYFVKESHYLYMIISNLLLVTLPSSKKKKKKKKKEKKHRIWETVGPSQTGIGNQFLQKHLSPSVAYSEIMALLNTVRNLTIVV